MRWVCRAVVRLLPFAVALLSNLGAPSEAVQGRVAGTASSLSLGHAQLALAGQQQDALMVDADLHGRSRRERNSTKVANRSATASGAPNATTTVGVTTTNTSPPRLGTTTVTSAAIPRDEAVGFLPVALMPGRTGAATGLLQQPGAPFCPLSSQLRAPRPVYLVTCAEYAGESCCTQDEDAAVRAMLQLHFEPV